MRGPVPRSVRGRFGFDRGSDLLEGVVDFRLHSVDRELAVSEPASERVEGRIGEQLGHAGNVGGRPSTAGFRTAAEARLVADLVVRKLQANQMPPTVTETELKRLRIP